MNKFYNYIITIFIFLSFICTYAQQDAQYTQYMYNTLAVNPAYAGSRGVLSIAALHRSQWIGLDGAPTTQTINFNTPVSERVGLGFSVVNDKIGDGTNLDTYFDGVFSYTVPTRKGSVAFGLKAGGHLLDINLNALNNYASQGIIQALDNPDKKFSPNFGAGTYYYTDKFYAGISVPNFLETEHFDTSNLTFIAQERINYYFITGYVFELNLDWKLKPTVLIKAVRGAPLQADLSVNFLYKDWLYLGGAYRWSAAFSGLLGAQLTDQLMVGLAYDKETTELGNTSFNSGSFEVFLRYEFRTRYKNVLTPRFF